MATLILTTVGSVLGGPIGGAIGAIAGQAIDQNVLFKPKGREGPRLTELAVQTSSYGTAIPRLFGTMRIAGTVIWSTDLIETKSTTGAKGQPSTTGYSYSVSFAVLLSARPIVAIGRIWADGKLLRGAAGDFKTATDFRLHTGGEGQDPDPLIASAEGSAAPAHRGSAYAVFEHFQLADYGNRIPLLTFEVIADAEEPTLGAIAEELGGGLIDGRDVTMGIPGFSAYGDSLRGVLETLATAGGAWFAPVGARLAMRDGGSTDRIIVDDGVGVGDRSGSPMRTAAAIETVPITISVGHYDPARDYQAGLQRARRPGAGLRHDRIDMPAALSAEAAKALAERTLVLAEQGRMRRSVSPLWSAIDVLPGDTVAIAGDPARWRVAGWSLEAMVLQLDLIRIGDRGALPLPAASSGRVLPAPDVAHGATVLHAFELPPLDDAIATSPYLLVAAAGRSPGWRRAALLCSIDDGARWLPAGATASAAVIGSLETSLDHGSVSLRDEISRIEVVLLHDGMSLVNASDAAMDAGANMALIGDEIVQFGRAEQIGPARWRLSRLLRGRRATETALDRHVIGERFVLLDAGSLARIVLPQNALGLEVRVMASGIGDTAAPVEARVPLAGASVLPPSPVHLRIDPFGGAAALRWVRRSRAGWRWADGGDVPLVEEREAYRISLIAPGGSATTIETADPYVDPLPPTSTGTVINVVQLGTYGSSSAAAITS